jgi:hypothetical protein
MRSLSPEAEALNASIAAAPSWRALQSVLESSPGRGEGLDAFQLVRMLGRAARLPSPGASEPDDLADFQGFVAGVYGLLLGRADAARPAQVSRALEAIARLGLYNGELVGALAARAERELHNFPDDDLATTLEAFAALGYALPESFAAQVLKRTQGRLPSMAARSLSALLPAMTRLGLTPSAEWMVAYADAAIANIRGFRAPEFQALLVGLASAGWHPTGPQQLQPLVDRCFPLLQYELRVARPGGSGGNRGPSAVASIDEDAASGGGGALQQQQQRSGGQRGGWRNGERSSPPPPVEPQVAIDWLVNVSWALAQMVAGTGAQLPQQWATVVFDRLQYVRRYMRPAELASLLSSCGYLGARPTDATLASLLRDLQNMYTDASGDDLANFAMAMAQFRYTPP